MLLVQFISLALRTTSPVVIIVISISWVWIAVGLFWEVSCLRDGCTGFASSVRFRLVDAYARVWVVHWCHLILLRGMSLALGVA